MNELHYFKQMHPHYDVAEEHFIRSIEITNVLNDHLKKKYLTQKKGIYVEMSPYVRRGTVNSSEAQGLPDIAFARHCWPLLSSSPNGMPCRFVWGIDFETPPEYLSSSSFFLGYSFGHEFLYYTSDDVEQELREIARLPFFIGTERRNAPCFATLEDCLEILDEQFNKEGFKRDYCFIFPDCQS